MKEHRDIKARAAEAEDEEQRKKIMMESSVFANNQQVSVAFSPLLPAEMPPNPPPLNTTLSRVVFSLF